MEEKDQIATTETNSNSQKEEILAFNKEQVLRGKHVAIGLYEKEKQRLPKASKNIATAMLKKLPAIKKSTRILIIGSGYGFTARWIVEKYGCKIDCLNGSEEENKQHIKLNEAAELTNNINVATGELDYIPFDHETYDFVWTQDTLWQSKDQLKTLREVSRVLKPGGRFIFTDPHETKVAPIDALDEWTERHQLEDTPTVKNYNTLARRADLERVYYKSYPNQIPIHYSRLLDLLQESKDSKSKKISAKDLEQLKSNLNSWVELAKAGHLTWGIFQFQKRNM